MLGDENQSQSFCAPSFFIKFLIILGILSNSFQSKKQKLKRCRKIMYDEHQMISPLVKNEHTTITLEIKS